MSFLYICVSIVVQSPSCVQLFTIPRTTVYKVSLSSLPPRVCPSSHPMNQWCHPTISFFVALFSFYLLFFPGSFPVSSAVHIRWAKFWGFSFSISPSKEHSGLISLWIDWFDLAVQETLKCLLQQHSLKASFLSTQPLMGHPPRASLLTSIRDYWKDHNLDYMNLCQQSDVFVF